MNPTTIKHLLIDILNNYQMGYESCKKLKNLVKADPDQFQTKTNYFVRLWAHRKDHTAHLYDLKRNLVIDLRNEDMDGNIDDNYIGRLSPYIDGDHIGFWLPDEIGDKIVRWIKQQHKSLYIS